MITGMLRFIIGLVVVIALIGGAYYYLSIKPIYGVTKQEEQLQIDAQVKKIPPGTKMEDGTIPE